MTQSNLTFTKNHEIPEGYKKTEIGVIPNDWIVENFSKITEVITCGVAATPQYVSEQLGKPFLSASNVKDSRIDFDKHKFIPIKLFEQITKHNKPELGDILYTRVGAGIGDAAVIDKDYEFAIYVSLTLIKLKKNLNSYYVSYLLNSDKYRDLAKNGQFAGGGVQNLNVEVVRSFQIPVPNLNEQEKIATALSDTDALISELEKLIEKKQAIKTATMQQLLTGKTRLPEFALCEDGTPKTYKDSELGQIPDDWYVRKLGELVEITSGESPSKFNFVNDGIPYFKVEQLNNGNFYAESTPYSVKLGKTILAGSLIFPKRGASILSNKIRILKVNACMDTNLMALTCSHELNPNYLLYSLSYGGLDKVADTTSIPQINNKHILPYKIFYPFIGEQIRISSILVDLENDIELSQQKVEKLRKIKLGMMQELLTGKTRLV